MKVDYGRQFTPIRWLAKNFLLLTPTNPVVRRKVEIDKKLKEGIARHLFNDDKLRLTEIEIRDVYWALIPLWAAICNRSLEINKPYYSESGILFFKTKKDRKKVTTPVNIRPTRYIDDPFIPIDVMAEAQMVWKDYLRQRPQIFRTDAEKYDKEMFIWGFVIKSGRYKEYPPEGLPVWLLDLEWIESFAGHDYIDNYFETILAGQDFKLMLSNKNHITINDSPNLELIKRARNLFVEKINRGNGFNLAYIKRCPVCLYFTITTSERWKTCGDKTCPTNHSKRKKARRGN
jgi:hypothetical protein